MWFAYGYDRFVFLVGKKAIKIARFPFFRFFIRIGIVNVFSQKKQKIFQERFGVRFILSSWRYLLRGHDANKREVEYFYLHQKDFRIMPVLSSYLCHWIIVQLRGSKISSEEFTFSCPFDDRFEEARKPHQLCHHPDTNQIVLVDYGDQKTCQLLHKSFL